MQRLSPRARPQRTRILRIAMRSMRIVKLPRKSRGCQDRSRSRRTRLGKLPLSISRRSESSARAGIGACSIDGAEKPMANGESRASRTPPTSVRRGGTSLSYQRQLGNCARRTAMPDLGERGNVMGPQPIGKVVEPPAAMLAAAGQLLGALMRGDLASAGAMTTPQAREEIEKIAQALKSGGYDKFELIARGRVAHHYFLKARLTGVNPPPFTIQFRPASTTRKWPPP